MYFFEQPTFKYYLLKQWQKTLFFIISIKMHSTVALLQSEILWFANNSIVYMYIQTTTSLPFFKDLLRLLLNYFMLLGCVNISDTIGWFSIERFQKVVAMEIQLFNPSPTSVFLLWFANLFQRSFWGIYQRAKMYMVFPLKWHLY